MLCLLGAARPPVCALVLLLGPLVRTHVCMACDTLFMHEWPLLSVLRHTEISSNNMDVLVLGDFPEGDAREYLRTCVMYTCVTDDEWAQIYQVKFSLSNK